MESYFVDTISVEIPGERPVARVAEGEYGVGSTDTGTARGQPVEDEELLRGGPEHRHGVTAVAVPVARQRQVAAVADGENRVGHARGAGVAQEDLASGRSVDPGSIDAVAVPVPDERSVPGIAEEHRGDGRVRGHCLPDMPTGRAVHEAEAITGVGADARRSGVVWQRLGIECRHHFAGIVEEPRAEAPIGHAGQDDRQGGRHVGRRAAVVKDDVGPRLEAAQSMAGQEGR